MTLHPDYFHPSADWSLVPDHMHGAMMRYVMNGIPPGSFLTAVMENDLMRATGSADRTNRIRLADVCVFVYNFTPLLCHGTPETVNKWIEAGGLVGLNQQKEDIGGN